MPRKKSIPKTTRAIFTAVLAFATACEVVPRNTLRECREQCKDSGSTRACHNFCDCIYRRGRPFGKCLDEYNKAARDSTREIEPFPPFDQMPGSYIVCRPGHEQLLFTVVIK